MPARPPKRRAKKSASREADQGSNPENETAGRAEDDDAEAETDDLAEEPRDEDIVDVAGEVTVVEDEVLAKAESPRDSLARLDPFQIYMREVQKHPLLTPTEEHELAVRYRDTGDVQTAVRLVTANLRLVVKLAYEYRRAYRNMMDLIQEGNIGLMQAVKRYDPYRGVKLSSYSAWWIRAYMLRFILNNWRMVKIGTTQAQRKLFFNLSKEKARLTAMGIEPTHEEISKRLGVTTKEVVEMDRRLARSDASLDATINEGDGRPTTRMELLPSTTAGPEDLAEGAELSESVRQHLDEFRHSLKGKDVIIFDKRLVAEDPLTLQELGDEFGVSRERVRQLEARITGRLRDFLRERLGDAVLVNR